MVSVKGTTFTAGHTTQTTGSGQTATTTGSAQKRKAADLPPGMPPSRKQKQAGSSTSTTSRKDDPAKWDLAVQSMGASGGGIPAVSTSKMKNLANAGEQLKQQESTANLIVHPEKPLDSPLSAFGRTSRDQLYLKSAAPNAGDHSPSVSAVDKVDSAETKIVGRNATPTPTGFNINEHKVPTLQFHTKPSFFDGDNHDNIKDSAAHTVFTSMREMHQAGEKGKGTVGKDGQPQKHDSMSELLDATARAYSPYNARGERVVSPVDASKNGFSSGAVTSGAQGEFRPLSEDRADARLAQLREARRAEFKAESPLPRVHINADGKDSEKLNADLMIRRNPDTRKDASGNDVAPANRPIEKVKSNLGVSPLVGQQMMNMWHRENLGQAPHGPDTSNPPMHNVPRQPRAPGQFPTQLPLGSRIKQQQVEAQKQWNALSPSQQQAQEAETDANVKRLGGQSPAPADDDAMDVDS